MLGGIISGISQVFGGVMSAIIPGMDGVNMSTAGANFSIANGLGSIVSGAGSIITSVLQNEANIKHAESLPNQAHGNANSSQVLSTLGELRFHGYRRYARRDYAESIDNFFTMFGYKTNKVKVPNVNVRENYTYTKTVNCQLDNHEMPAVYYDKIISVYNKGVRFWKVPAFIGNYSITNRPLSELT